MNYKISTYVLSAMLAGTIIYSCNQKSESSATTTNDSGSSDALSATSIEADTSLMSMEYAKALMLEKPHRGSGQTIPLDDAWDILDVYKRDRGITDCKSPNPDPRRIYGFTFGMESIKEYMERIFKMDQQYPDSLLGIRVYYALRADTNPQTGRRERRPEIFLIPVGMSGKAIHPVDDCDLQKSTKTSINDGTIFDTSVPCPNRCE